MHLRNKLLKTSKNLKDIFAAENFEGLIVTEKRKLQIFETKFSENTGKPKSFQNFLKFLGLPNKDFLASTRLWKININLWNKTFWVRWILQNSGNFLSNLSTFSSNYDMRNFFSSSSSFRLSPSKKNYLICFNESPLKMTENVFYFTLTRFSFSRC